jgi:hypothetical protein
MEYDSNFEIDKLTCLGESIEQTAPKCTLHKCRTKNLLYSLSSFPDFQNGRAWVYITA